MSFKDIKTEFAYETGINNVVEDFYIPFLSEAKRYDRITGFFSSTSLALAARGVAGLIANSGTMRLICCPRLNNEDVSAINKAIKERDRIIESRMFSDITSMEDDFQKDHIAALGWMIASGYLTIKIAIMSDGKGLWNYEKIENNPIMHQKVGVMYDEDFNSISFSGSNNESASGWLYNSEEFKVFKAWETGQKAYYNADRKKFESMWNNEHAGVEVVDLPEAIKKHLIEEGQSFSVERIALQNYREKLSKRSFVKKQKKSLRLFFYQEDAVKKWVNNDKRILLEMVTGSGKTRTSIGCIDYLFKHEERPVVVVVACPQTTLSLQWKDDIDNLDINVNEEIICDSSSPKWYGKLDEKLFQLSTGLFNNLIIYTTHATCCTERFIQLIHGIGIDVALLFIGDEVHGMGSSEHKHGLLDVYEYRIGCSATPSRWYDELGTTVINNYFNNCSFEFTIEDALTKFNPVTNKHFLVSYFYHPCFVSMTEAELEKYQKITQKLVRMKKSDDMEALRTILLNQRASIEKNSENKFSELKRILDEIGDDIKDTIIFVSDEQLHKVIEILGQRSIMCHEFTMKQSAKPSPRFGGLSEREYLINKFREGDYQVLVAIKCLDEGIDIPSAKRAIIMASSTNPREYIQRIGRIIRQADGKSQADLYDLIVCPDFSSYKDETLEKIEKDIFRAELRRVKELSNNAMNNADTALSVMRMERKLL